MSIENTDSSSNQSIQRVNYFTGEALFTDDFKAEQAYHMNVIRHHNQGFYTPGVVSGLAVKWQTDSETLIVEPGLAIDSLGREIILLGNQSITTGSLGKGERCFLMISYSEKKTHVPDSSPQGQYKRIALEPVLTLGPRQQGNIVLAAITMHPAHDGVPQSVSQEGRTLSQTFSGGLRLLSSTANSNADSSNVTQSSIWSFTPMIHNNVSGIGILLDSPKHGKPQSALQTREEVNSQQPALFIDDKGNVHINNLLIGQSIDMCGTIVNGKNASALKTVIEDN